MGIRPEVYVVQKPLTKSSKKEDLQLGESKQGIEVRPHDMTGRSHCSGTVLQPHNVSLRQCVTGAIHALVSAQCCLF